MGVVRLFITVFIRKRNSGEAPNTYEARARQQALKIPTDKKWCQYQCHPVKTVSLSFNSKAGSALNTYRESGRQAMPARF